MKKNNLISLFLVVFFVIFSWGVFLSPVNVVATTPLDGLDIAAGEISSYKNQVGEGSTYDESFVALKLGDMIGMILSFVGVLFLILIIFAGISWMTAAGNDQKIEKAKSLIINAVIGLLIVLSAYAITNFIGSQFAG